MPRSNGLKNCQKIHDNLLMRLISELKRRNVLRMATIYAVAAWLIMQVADVLIGLANLPESIGPVIVVLLGVGFPIALAVSWFYELTSEGISFDKGSEAEVRARHAPTRRMNVILIALLSAGLLLFAYERWWIGPPPERSIAVLPFADLSAGQDQTFFSDGISEEILNVLAKIPELRVMSRTSSFRYRGDVHLPDVAKELNVLYVLEGSVRRAGDRIRVTAQLIDARSNTHLWSENFDRALTDVFAIQDDIAASIADELKLRLASTRPPTKTTDPETYALYLQARHFQAIQWDHPEEAEALLTQVLERDPEFVPALNLMVTTIFSLTGGSDNHKYAQDDGIRRMRDYVDRALAIDPDNSEALAHRGWMAFFYSGDLETAASFIERALLLDPTNPQTLWVASVISRRLGRNDDAIEFAETALTRDPLCSGCLYTLALARMRSGQFDRALAAAERRAQLMSGGWFTQGDIYLLRGDINEALQSYEKQDEDRIAWLGRSAIAFHELGEVDARDAALEELKTIDESRARVYVAEVFAWIDNNELAFEWLYASMDPKHPAFAASFETILWSPFLQNLRDDSRWLELRGQADMSPERLERIRISMPAID